MGLHSLGIRWCRLSWVACVKLLSHLSHLVEAREKIETRERGPQGAGRPLILPNQNRHSKVASDFPGSRGLIGGSFQGLDACDGTKPVWCRTEGSVNRRGKVISPESPVLRQLWSLSVQIDKEQKEIFRSEPSKQQLVSRFLLRNPKEKLMTNKTSPAAHLQSGIRLPSKQQPRGEPLSFWKPEEGMY